MLLDASFMCGCGSTRGSTCGSEEVWPTRVQQAEREHVAEEEVPGSPLDGPAELFRRGLWGNRGSRRRVPFGGSQLL